MNGQDCGQLTLFPEDSRASLFPSPGSAEAVRMTVTSGQKCCALLKNSGPLGSLAKMLLESSIWRSTRRYLIWKPKATPQGRLLFRLAPSTPRTDGIDALLLPTPTASDTKGQNNYQKTLKRLSQGQRAHLGQLPNFLMVLIGCKGRVNPVFYEEIMGFPIGWTELEASETP